MYFGPFRCTVSQGAATRGAGPSNDFGPASGQERKFRWITVLLGATAVMLAVLLTLSLSFGGALLPRPTSSPPQILTLTGVDRSIVYWNGTANAIGSSVNDSCPQCPLSFPAGATLAVSLFSLQVNKSHYAVALHLFLNSTIPAEPFAGYSCPGPSSCGPPPAVTSSSSILILVNGYSSTWDIVFDPPARASTADDGGVSLTIYVTTCSEVNTDWNYCG
jgi:hypothetical protein